MIDTEPPQLAIIPIGNPNTDCAPQNLATTPILVNNAATATKNASQS